MSWLLAVWSVFCFEWRRTATLSRIVIWLGLVLFPAAIVTLIRIGAPGEIDAIIWDVTISALVATSCLLGLLFWATPIVSEERSANTWSYLAVRSCGVAAVVLGKYFNSVGWAVLTAGVAMSLAVLIAQPPHAYSLWLTLLALTLVGAPAYAAAFALLGVAFERISMGLAFVYALLVEGFIATIPAVINQITIRYRLQTLLARWRDWPLEFEGYESMTPIDPGPDWQQIAIVLAVAAVLMGVVVLIARSRELVKPERG